MTKFFKTDFGNSPKNPKSPEKSMDLHFRGKISPKLVTQADLKEFSSGAIIVTEKLR
jgi:hypothetical protein